MELKQVHKYVDLYFEGQTTREQEVVLMDYFTQPVVDANLVQFKPYFEAIANERSQICKGKLQVKPASKTKWRRAIAIAVISIFGFFMTQINTTQAKLGLAQWLTTHPNSNIFTRSVLLNKPPS